MSNYTQAQLENLLSIGKWWSINTAAARLGNISKENLRELLFSFPTGIDGITIQKSEIDDALTDEWGKRTAARAYHIICTGRDGTVDQGDANRPEATHMIRVNSEFDVPGSKPTENLLDVNHALTWIASRQDTIQTRIEMRNDVPYLINNLSERI